MTPELRMFHIAAADARDSLSALLSSIEDGQNPEVGDQVVEDCYRALGRLNALPVDAESLASARDHVLLGARRDDEWRSALDLPTTDEVDTRNGGQV